MAYCSRCGHDCDEDDDRPKITQAVLDIQPLIKKVYKFSSGGGNLHSAIDDGNLDCIATPEEIRSQNWVEAGKAQLNAECKCAEALAALDLEEREAACGLFHGDIDADGNELH